MSAPLLFPVGHYAGALYPKAGAPMSYRKIRVGVDVRRLSTELEFAVWGLAHGVPERVARRPWTRAEARTLAGELGLDGIDPVVERLIANRVAVEVSPGTPEAEEFVRTHRVLPLLMGVGNSPANPLAFGIGIPGTPQVVSVEGPVFELWQWGRLGPSLWHTCTLLAAVDGRPLDEVVTRALHDLHLLLASNVAYLDVTLDDPEEPTDEE